MKSTKRSRRRAMGKSVGERLMAGMKEMDEWLATGKPLDACFTGRTVRELPEPSTYDPKRIAALRRRIGASQSVFARLIGASPALVRAWEGGDRHPSAMARRLLDEIGREPDRWAAILQTAQRQPAA